MDPTTLILIASIVAGLLVAFSLGANDVANSMAPAVGAKAISIWQAVLIAAVLNFIGAMFLGSNVTDTICKGIIDPAVIPTANMLAVGMLAALLSTGVWILIATMTELPVSSTHSIVGSLLGFGLIAGGIDVVQWGNIGGIVLSWIISPFFSGLIAFLIFIHIRRYILVRKDVLGAAVFWAPIWGSLTLALVILSFLYKTPYGKSLGISMPVGLLLTAVIMAVTTFFYRRHIRSRLDPRVRPNRSVENIFRNLQICTACYVAISQGANDVANAIGPVAAIYGIAKGTYATEGGSIVPLWLLAMGGAGIAVGIVCLGHKVMNTVGKRITKLTNTRGFAVAFGAATTVLLASNLGMPVSTTHAAVGAVVGVGVARGFGAVDFRVLYKIVLYWVLTLPIAAITCIVIYQLLRWTIFTNI
ncbi:MAG: inorganic phosphate transporter [Desulfovibrionaceae bacterium]|nr:inorganic phosphate transporter [Desulfovibrionaceae bacterium]